VHSAYFNRSNFGLEVVTDAAEDIDEVSTDPSATTIAGPRQHRAAKRIDIDEEQ
jgi:hypothetical protein